MTLISLIVAIVLVGLLLWLAGFIPMDPAIRRILQVVVIVFLVLWLLQAIGLFGAIGNIRLN